MGGSLERETVCCWAGMRHDNSETPLGISPNYHSYKLSFCV